VGQRSWEGEDGGQFKIPLDQRAVVAQRSPVLLGNRAVRGVLALDVEKMAPLGEVDGGRNRPLSGLLNDVSLAEADRSVFVSVS